MIPVPTEIPEKDVFVYCFRFPPESCLPLLSPSVQNRPSHYVYVICCALGTPTCFNVSGLLLSSLHSLNHYATSKPSIAKACHPKLAFTFCVQSFGTAGQSSRLQSRCQSSQFGWINTTTTDGKWPEWKSVRGCQV